MLNNCVMNVCNLFGETYFLFILKIFEDVAKDSESF